MSVLPKIAFQGEPGANSHEACRTYFPDHQAAPYPTFEEAFEAAFFKGEFFEEGDVGHSFVG